MPKKTPPSATTKVLGGLAYAIWLGFALGVGTLYGWASRNSIIRGIIDNPVAFLNKDPKQSFGGRDSLNLLVLGCDEDRFYHGVKLHGQNIYNKYSRSDMMLLTRLDFANDKITGLSIPRDTQCTLPGWGKHKINAYHEIAQQNHKGQENQITQEAVEHLLGVHVDKVVVLDFEAFQKLVDLVGGVDIFVPKAMKYDDYAGELHVNIKAGQQHLNGYDAMGFVRFRHDSEGDFNRQARQKEFLMAFKQSAFRDFLKLPEIANDGKQVLNGAFSDDELLGLVAFARKVPQDRIQMGMVPVVPGPGTYLLVDKPKLKPTLAQYGFGSSSEGHLSARL